MAKQSFKVSGMHCSSCEKLVGMEVGAIKGVKSVRANAAKGIVEVEGNFEPAEVKKAIVGCGYKV